MDEVSILRELASRYAEIAARPENAEREHRARLVNGLNEARPLVWVDEVPWHELEQGGELTLLCEGERERSMERFFRRKLYQWKHFQGDMVAEPFYRVTKSWESTGIGVQIEEHRRSVDERNNIYSHGYIDQLDSMEALERLHAPVITAHPKRDAENVKWAEEILRGILPVRLTSGYLYCSPWDQIAMLRGMEPMLMDLVCEPELMHATMKKFVEIFTAEIDQRDALGLFDNDIPDLHCTPGYCDEQDEKAARGLKGRAASSWYRGMAQPFSSVSPDMFEEYEVEYILPMAARFGLSYYGCCEPLHDRMDRIFRIPNLRKVGVSSWADVERSAELLGKDYVYARKPNPALVAGDLDEDAIRAEARATLAACRKYNCPCEFVLKDISTVGYKPANLTRWMELMESVIDEFY